MKLNLLIKLLVGISIFCATSVLADEAWQFTGKAWEALAKNDFNTVERLANESVRRWGEQARVRNNELFRLPSAKEAKKNNILNEVATIVWLKGEALLKKGDRDGALAVYYIVIADYGFGQTWDSKGWYWSPAASSRDRIAELSPRSQSKLTLKTDPLDAALKLPGKKGICFTLREEEKEGSCTQNLPKIKAVNSYWNYSWGTNRVEAQPDSMEFIPMAWGAWGKEGLKKALQNDVVPQIQSGKAKRLLGFNEPDKKEQANMPYTEALKYWPMLEDLGIPLCSPACANPLSDFDDSTQGVRGTWMRDFMREADKRNYRIDYIGVHWYGGPSPRSFKERMIEVYEAYDRRPLLISEFAVADWGAKSVKENPHSQESVLKFMKDVLPWMESQNWIAGYAWFSFGIDEAVGTSSALFDHKGNLTTLGRFYQSVNNENPYGD
ncbi:MAG: glycosyl hydrolase [Verrucomicrobiota bacterium]|nr:glycosyl hydrolase [Verrucomicrobiota bacterium]